MMLFTATVYIHGMRTSTAPPQHTAVDVMITTCAADAGGAVMLIQNTRIVEWRQFSIRGPDAKRDASPNAQTAVAAAVTLAMKDSCDDTLAMSAPSQPYSYSAGSSGMCQLRELQQLISAILCNHFHFKYLGHYHKHIATTAASLNVNQQSGLRGQRVIAVAVSSMQQHSESSLYISFYMYSIISLCTTTQHAYTKTTAASAAHLHW
eukprot:10364-Heterococcus_DN1.PRE.1